MSILNDVLNSASTSSSNNARGGEERKKKSMLWLNVGVNVPGGGKDGSDLFVSLPFGIPLDDMRYAEASGNSEDYAKLVQAKNALLDVARAQGAGMDPGANEILKNWSVQIQRAAEPSSRATGEDNDLIKALSALL